LRCFLCSQVAIAYFSCRLHDQHSYKLICIAVKATKLSSQIKQLIVNSENEITAPLTWIFSCWILVWFTLWSCRWWRYVTPKRRVLSEVQGLTTHERVLPNTFIYVTKKSDVLS
jgi:hypothetical protein